MENSGEPTILEHFHPHVAQWFREVFAAPTSVQQEAWEAISAGHNALVVAPTGSGKTLAAFLWSINHLLRPAAQQAIPEIQAAPNVSDPTFSDSPNSSKREDSHTRGQSRADGAESESAEFDVVQHETAQPGTTQLSSQRQQPGVRVLYISPLKALGVDVQQNLRAPITGIQRTAARMGIEMEQVRIGVRSGDTPAAERARQQRKPPEILITTPESAYLMATSKARGMFATVDTIIIDEIHALAGTKRGAHLALTLERIAALAQQPVQRIGLSATVRPIETVAQFLAGDRPVRTVAPNVPKQWDLQVRVPVPDFNDLPDPKGNRGSEIAAAVLDDDTDIVAQLLEAEAAENEEADANTIPTAGSHQTIGMLSDDAETASSGITSPEELNAESDVGEFQLDEDVITTAQPGQSGLPQATEAGTNLLDESALPQQNSIWPFIEAELYEEILAHYSTLVFVNSRRSAERLTSRLNELYAADFAPDSLSAPLRRDPAQLMKTSDTAGQAAPLLARAHHGSVSKDERTRTEQLLKAGELRAVVATSSLELGIDMGAIDLVVQVEAPPSVAAGLQRVGRAGHTVGAVSHGVFYPKHAADVVHSAVIVEQMRRSDGQGIEAIAVPENALDVLLQQTVAAVSVADMTTDAWYALVRRAYPYRNLSRDVFDAVLDLASGKYPDTDFVHLKPRISIDPDTQVMQARPGAQRVAVTNAGTIPDRGLFGVFLVAGEETQQGLRVGELDEEMVYESRVGDVFTLGASSWRIQDITHDRVLVTPAPGHTGRLPFWTGDQLGRPAELGVAIGRFQQQVLRDPTVLEGSGLDEYAQENVLRYLTEQQEATGSLPDAHTIVFERFQDELGDWRIVVHSPWGRRVHAAWSLAISHRIAEATGMDAQPVSGDDGIILRLPQSATPPDPSFLIFDPDEIAEIITEQVGNSALFASRFRECAARGLLLPRHNPGQRAPLWQQRQRAAQLLDIARNYPTFPIILETVRECLHDVYDLDALQQVCRDLDAGTTRIIEVTTQSPSPFALSLLFSYTGAFMYEGDSPLAEKRAAALSLDPQLLAQLLGTATLKELLDPAIIDQVESQLQRESERAPQTAEQFIDVLRTIGPVAVDKAPAVGWDDRVYAKRIMLVRIAGVEHVAVVEDAALLRDGLGIPVPAGYGADPAFIADAALQLLKRWARAHGPFSVTQAAHAFGLAPAVAHQLLEELVSQSVLVRGEFRHEPGEYVAPEVLRIIRNRCLAAARAEIEPLSHTGYARFLAHYQQVAAVGARPALEGVAGVFEVISQLAGVRLPASAWETVVLGQRVADYHPSMLDELTNAGEVRIIGAGHGSAHDPWVMLLPAAEFELHYRSTEQQLSIVEESILGFLARGGAYRFDDVARQLTGDTSGMELHSAWWQLFEAGMISPDSFEPLRLRLAHAKSSKTSKAARSTQSAGTRALQRSRVPVRSLRGRAVQQRGTSLSFGDMVGRWAVIIVDDAEQTLSPTERSVAELEVLGDRYGIITRGSVQAEGISGGFAGIYKVGVAREEAGQLLRGYLVEGLGASQFARSTIIDQARSFADAPDVGGWPSGTVKPTVYVLAAADPANPYGAALAWPFEGAQRAGGLVVLIDGLCAAYSSRSGKSLLLAEPPEGIEHQQWSRLIVGAFQQMVRCGLVGEFTLDKVNGQAVFQAAELHELVVAGARKVPSGLRIGAGGNAVVTGQRGRSLAQALEDLE
ncbi:MAG: DEAD/DEAH box helicase [Corynebacterium sp.]|nr:DEAD/DEAH box helicase [Corynebacterium sp.]